MAADAEEGSMALQEPGSSAAAHKASLSLAGDAAFDNPADKMGNQQERSPLLSPNDSVDTEAEAFLQRRRHGEDDRFEQTRGFWYFLLLTVSLGGLQISWAVELSNGTPYLLSLGISKSVMALVWIAGPLSGALVQPYIGILSDNCRSPWGKRRPFMAIGTLATILSLAGLAWTRELVGGFFGIFGADPTSEFVKVVIRIVAVLFVYVLDVAINTVQATIRAFILDCCPSHQQETANAMASRVIGIGNILGYTSGYIDLPKHLWFFGNTQFKVLCVIASAGLAGTVALSSSTIKERDPRLDGPPTQSDGGVLAFFRSVFRSMRRLPPQTRKVCEVQFFAWIGWFPQLFYTSSYVGDIYVQSFLRDDPNMTDAQIDKLYEEATRIGAYALLWYAIVSLTTNVFLPFLIAPSYDAPDARRPSAKTKLEGLLAAMVVPGLTLRRAWMISQLIFVACMFSTLVVSSVRGATVLVAFLGLPWALTLWAPFAIISAEVSKRNALRRKRRAPHHGDPKSDAPHTVEGGADTDDNDADDEVDQAGTILGIHNMAIAMPQILATLASSLAFRFLQKPRGTPGDRSFAYVLAGGGVSTLVAAWLTSRIRDEVPVVGEAVVENGDAAEQVGSRASHESHLDDDDARDEDGGDGGVDGRPAVARTYRPRRSTERPLMRSGSFSGAGGVGF